MIVSLENTFLLFSNGEFLSRNSFSIDFNYRFQILQLSLKNKIKNDAFREYATDEKENL